MTAADVLAPPATRSGGAVRPVERACVLVGAVLVVSGLVHLLVFAVDGGPWYGPVSWRKPVTFGLSFGVTLWAVTWVASYLRLGERARVWLLGVLAADCVLEVAGITVQAWRGVPSHLNTETPVDTAVATSLAFGGAVLVLVLGSLAVTALRGRIDAEPSMRLALIGGFALLVVGLISGAAMIARGVTLVNAGQTERAYHEAGSLKLVHGVTLHAILVLPLLAWLLARTTRPEAQRLRAVRLATAAYLLAAVLALLASVLR